MVTTETAVTINATTQTIMATAHHLLQTAEDPVVATPTRIVAIGLAPVPLVTNRIDAYE
jgi:hypothetical protein